MSISKVSVLVAAGLAGILCREAVTSEGPLFWYRFGWAAVCLTFAMFIQNRITKS